MLLKIVGSICIMAGAYAYGYCTGLDYKRHIEQLEELNRIIWQISGEITYTKAPLTEVFQRVGGRLGEPYGGWLRALAKEMEQKGQRTLGILWREAVENHLKKLLLTEEEWTELKNLGGQMGYLDIHMQEAALSWYGKKLEERREALLAGLQEKRRVAACLGAAGGVFLVIILV
ncbi:stage III sporulation protein AB [Bariatricus massiliensis]|uniref:Stage III sporulation protein AB n=1 Tax=Bariatricus massiliensis TaxID=1745713 RepID=A0ABS8DD47_9FIRM|nr:stage III sporulation protein AB [Bariatricus massiliensis]MCB7303530.1 stage III sporulation protein AB [Bariatricus massiliensis]MCB7373662.1 stage III sporulation protein AB [Bariatricus massiliensis]MCB7386332.1 stage III sporulation protein AB [Bariatricus massiliensis]MCB7410494.1 stage III sporulation protein AB [Bariatricus massiliensis]MCQ5252222.1 stage III sporulation protein AB [Bariatricus massiliensis]